MKLLVSLQDDKLVQLAEEGTQFAKAIAEAKSNSQHLQVPGFVITEVRLMGCCTEINLLHPETKADSGHVDVKVIYREDKVSFHIYQGFERFVPSDDFRGMEICFPTGAWSLVMTVVSIENYLEKTVGFIPRVRPLLLSGLK